MKQLVNEYSIMLLCAGVLFLIDLLTGVIKAIYNQSFSSEKFRKTLPKFTSYIAVLVIGAIIQLYFEVSIVLKLTGTVIILTEITSVIENINNFITIPKALTDFLELKKNEIDESEDIEQ